MPTALIHRAPERTASEPTRHVDVLLCLGYDRGVHAAKGQAKDARGDEDDHIVVPHADQQGQGTEASQL